ncbi:MAG: CAP domain-containing protein, partial [Candidatus Binatia bacterium]
RVGLLNCGLLGSHLQKPSPLAPAPNCSSARSTVACTPRVRLPAMSDLRTAMICLINAERTARQLPALNPNMALDDAARGHAGEAQRLKWWTEGADPHVNPETRSTIDSRIKAAGYCGGNPNRTSEIAYTWAGDQATLVGAVNWWMNISKAGHREAILDASSKDIGVGIGGQVADKTLQLQTDMGTYVVNFGACASGAPAPQAKGSPADTKLPTDTIVKPDSGGLFQEKLKYRDRILKSP